MSTTLERLIGTALGLKDSIEVLEEKLKKAKADLTYHETVLIPDAMSEIGLDEVTTTDGIEVKCGAFVSAKIPEDSSEAFDWLRDNGHQDVIKNTFTIDLTRGEDKKAEMLRDLLGENGFDYKRKEGVHYQTLQAFAKDQMNKGVLLPEGAFEVFYGTKATIKKRKKK